MVYLLGGVVRVVYLLGGFLIWCAICVGCIRDVSSGLLAHLFFLCGWLFEVVLHVGGASSWCIVRVDFWVSGAYHIGGSQAGVPIGWGVEPVVSIVWELF